MKFRNLLLLLFSASLFLNSCKKEEDEQRQKTTAEKILGKWQLDKLLYHSVYDGIDERDSLIGTAADYFDFRTDGKVYLNIEGEADTSAYSVISDTKLSLFEETFDIRNLTENDFSFYIKAIDSTNPVNYDELAFDLKR